MSEIVDRLVKFREVLENPDVKHSKKVKILKTLSTVELTLSEISKSGIAKTVKNFKKLPEELGTLARQLVAKWKSMLDDQLITEDPQKTASTSEGPNPYNESDPNIPKKKIKFSEYTQQKPHTTTGETLDSSCGLSFMDCISVKPAKKSTSKRVPLPKSAVSSLANSMASEEDKPDSARELASDEKDQYEHEFESGNLKFRSTRVIYAPRAAAPVENSDSIFWDTMPSLLDICVRVLAKNISRVDYVGALPWDIFKKCIAEASLDDLIRIEKCNPQLADELCSEDPFEKHVNRLYATANWSRMKRMNPNRPLGELVSMLQEETDKKLNSFIHRAANRIQAEKDSQRSVRTVEVIVPRSVQRTRNAISQRTIMQNRFKHAPMKQHQRISTSASSTQPIAFKPKNMSHPDGLAGLSRERPRTSSATSKPKLF